MPYLSVEVSKELTELEKKDIKLGVYQILNDVAGKGEKYLMISIKDQIEIFFGGELGNNAYLELKLLGGLKKEQKDEITKQVNKLFEEKIGIDKTSLYIVYDEVERENWGFNEKTFA